MLPLAHPHGGRGRQNLPEPWDKYPSPQLTGELSVFFLGPKTRLSLKIMLVALGVVCGLVPEAALATTQFSDILYLNGQKLPLNGLPLEQLSI